jgi:hypothetical protein
MTEHLQRRTANMHDAGPSAGTRQVRSACVIDRRKPLAAVLTEMKAPALSPFRPITRQPTAFPASGLASPHTSPAAKSPQRLRHGHAAPLAGSFPGDFRTTAPVRVAGSVMGRHPKPFTQGEVLIWTAPPRQWSGQTVSLDGYFIIMWSDIILPSPIFMSSIIIILSPSIIRIIGPFIS